MQASAFVDVISRVESKLYSSFRTVRAIRDPWATEPVLAVSAVDKKLGTATHRFSSLFTRRNDLLPFSLLCPEILIRVFRLLALDEPLAAFAGKQNLGWIKVAHICQRWRQVALDNPSLRVRISSTPTNISCILEMLARAKNAPLDLDIDLDGAPNLGVVRQGLTMFELSTAGNLKL